MEKVDYSVIVGEGGKEKAKRIAAGVAGPAAAATVAEVVVAAGCGTALCTVGAPVVAGIAAAAGAAAAVGWLWGSIFD